MTDVFYVSFSSNCTIYNERCLSDWLRDTKINADRHFMNLAGNYCA